jgi:CheY-like chemotaxis protein/signal transduction histidine kinase
LASSFRIKTLNQLSSAQNPAGSSLLNLSLVSARTLTWAVALILVVILGNLAMLHRNLTRVREHNRLVLQTHDVLRELELTLAAVAESVNNAQNFLFTQDEPFLQTFQAGRTAALDNVRKLKNLTSDAPEQQEKAALLWDRTLALLQWQSATIESARQDQKGGPTVLTQVSDVTAQAKAHMDEIRLIVQDMKDSEGRKLRERTRQAETATNRQEQSILVVAAVIVLLLLLVQSYIRRTIQQQHGEAQRLNDENWLKTRLAEVSRMLRGKETPEEVGRAALEFLAAFLGMQVGAFYVLRHGGLQLTASFAQKGPLEGIPQTLGLRDSLAAEALQNKRWIELEDVPPEYMTVSSALGATVPRRVVILPLHTDKEASLGFVEMGFLRALPQGAADLFAELKSTLSVAVSSALAWQRQQELLEETQRQAEELAAQQEELRTSHEKLEQQAGALQSSQEELRQSNEELGQQAQAMAQQKAALAERNDWLQAAKSELETKARELEQASRYKSEFLANMSHELRTPLNSLLLLATLLVENKEKTLTEKQIDYAQTIFKSGHDLLALINDILDLSKVEAGRLELLRENVDLDTLVTQLRRNFELTATEKGLALVIQRQEEVPSQIVSDSQRLLQIMKNLVSNALKFTPAGRVTVSIEKGRGPVPILFRVQDTGIGISEDKQALIFEAFKQSDGSVNRTYGGTGLGLTISRELAALLGGSISLQSTPGVGSTFTLHLPLEMPRSDGETAPVPAPELDSLPPQEAESSPTFIPEALQPDDRLILVVEDDATFSRLMTDLAHEAGFKAVQVNRGEAALEFIRTHPISAVLLDIKLPDISGLSILERLKADPATRHIPIHVISGANCVQNALTLGAIGYLQKPAQADELKTIFRRIDGALAQKVKKVLLVEDDKCQRQATKDLLGSDDIAITEARSGAEARQKLWTETFDCMILDLRLPDISGFELLEAMETELPGSKPPVVVYTAKELSREEQERLERYAQSIVIKGARSPERLLDEVSLFLHRLESSLPPQSQTLLQQLRSDALGLKGRRILLVDDDMRNVYALVNALENHGLKISVARNGRQCLSQLEVDPEIELVLMDIMMPEMDGYETMRFIRQNPAWKKLSIIALTAKAMKGDLEQCLEAGANDYLPKPVHLERLLSLLKVWLPQRI